MLSFEKQDTKGRAAMLALFDAGTFVETGAFVRRKGDDQPYPLGWLIWAIHHILWVF